ncbi:BnaCnng37340D [Brassica napus]|uniref:BnaCnng37340D protein n=1 Tax=Brassica napus TaxID=3708 RepID=A0A078JAT5_BRANA|nr:BnaCnng37340D [Brassica napus]
MKSDKKEIVTSVKAGRGSNLYKVCSRQNRKVIGDFGNLVNIPTGKYAASGGLKDVVNDDIDALDAGNKLAVVEYADDIFKFYKSIEEEGRDYMGSQSELNIKMRSILIVDMGTS